MRDFREFLIVLTVLTVPTIVSAKLCKSIDVRNTFSRLEEIRNCTIISGSLQIVLIDDNATNFDSYTFPELREITDYLMFFRVKRLTSIGSLFPNLAVIRGRNLFRNYALIIFEMENLNEVGLYNMLTILRGSVRIEKNENLCYVDTINWSRIAPKNTELMTVTQGKLCAGQSKCRSECNGNCWNEQKCQLSLENSVCSGDCLYGCNGTKGYCEVCKNMFEDNRCVSKCSPNKYLLKMLSWCVTKEDCYKFDDGNWWVHGKECLNECPPEYEKVDGTCKKCTPWCHKVCVGAEVNNIESISQLKGCTNITGTLIIRLDSELEENIERELEENLGQIEEITEYLMIQRIVPVRNLNFLKSLKVIKGMQLAMNRYALWVHENSNLEMLFDPPRKIQIENGTFSFHFNPKLCPAEIDSFAEVVQLKMNYTYADVSNYSNGDSFACNHVNINVSLLNVTTTSANIKWTPIQNTTNFLIFHKEVDDSTLFSEEDDCGAPTWTTTIAFFNDDQTEFTWNITNLRTYTNYTYFVRTDSRFGGRSEVQYFLTLSGDPSVPMNVRTEPGSSGAIRLLWDKPTNINGILSHYIIVGYFEMDKKSFIDGRNYCKLKMIETIPETAIETTTVVNIMNDTCACEPKVDHSVVTVIQKEDFDAICNDLDKFTYNESRGIHSHGCASYKYQIIPEHRKQNEVMMEKREETTTIATDSKFIVKLDEDMFEKHVEPNATSIVIDQLKHYSIYILLMAACNVNRTEEAQCSSVVMVSQRTGKNPSADNIVDLVVVMTGVYDVQIMWSEPNEPNAVIVSYDVIYRNLNKTNSQNIIDCITRLEHEQAKYKYNLKNLLPGEYVLNVRANSLAGPGNLSPTKIFSIVTPSNTSPLLFTVCAFILFLVLIVGLYLYWRYKVRPLAQMQQLIANVNPEYADFQNGDKWNIMPENIELKEELGKGTFGKVYNGFVTTLEEGTFPCAIKTLNDGSTIHDQMEFVNEAAVMKNFSEAHHVVKLIGVVTRGPLMVVMELMERGDLKTYLRNSRENSTSLGFPEICRMAIEIADGMSYLAAKKYVHRDLAARNCMVSRDRTVKIGDFGMTRDIYETDYYRKETRGLLPVRWMAPESLADGVFTSDSDAWSYGVVLWEIVTSAEQPYQGMSNEQVLQFIVSGGTLSRPKECPDLIWQIMHSCFNWLPSKRPLFMEIVEMLDTHVGADFRLVSFYYSRAGADFRRTTAEVNAARLEHQPAMQQGRITAHWNRDDEDEVHFHADSPSGSPTTISLLNCPHSLPNDYSPCPGTSGSNHLSQ